MRYTDIELLALGVNLMATKSIAGVIIINFSIKISHFGFYRTVLCSSHDPCITKAQKGDREIIIVTVTALAFKIASYKLQITTRVSSTTFTILW